MACWLNGYGFGLGLGLGLGQGLGARECTSCTFFFLWSYECGEHLCLHWFSSLRKYAMGYLTCHMVSHFRTDPCLHECQGELWKPENEQILSELATHSQPVLLGIRLED